jgi:hypothetical protein
MTAKAKAGGKVRTPSTGRGQPYEERQDEHSFARFSGLAAQVLKKPNKQGAKKR